MSHRVGQRRRDKEGFSATAAAILLQQPYRTLEGTTSQSHSHSPTVGQSPSPHEVTTSSAGDGVNAAEASRHATVAAASPKKRTTSVNASASADKPFAPVAPWATSEIPINVDKATGKAVRAPLISEAREAQLGVANRDPKRFEYFYQKHLGKMEKEGAFRNNSVLSASEVSKGRGTSTAPHDQEQSSQGGNNCTNNTTQQQSSLPLFTPNAYQRGPSKFFGEYDEVKRHEARDRIEKARAARQAAADEGRAAFKKTRDATGYAIINDNGEGGNSRDENNNDRSTGGGACCDTGAHTSSQQKQKPQKRRFPHSSLAHVIDRRTDFLRQMTEEELSAIAKTSIATGERERVLSTRYLSPLGARAALHFGAGSGGVGGRLLPPIRRGEDDSSSPNGMLGEGDGTHQQQGINASPQQQQQQQWAARQGPRIVSQAFKEQLKDRAALRDLSFARSHALSAEKEGRYEQALSPPRQQKGNDEYSSAGEGDPSSPSNCRGNAKSPRGIGGALIKEDAAKAAAIEHKKAEATEHLAKSLAAQRIAFEDASPVRQYEAKKALRARYEAQQKAWERGTGFNPREKERGAVKKGRKGRPLVGLGLGKDEDTAEMDMETIMRRISPQPNNNSLTKSDANVSNGTSAATIDKRHHRVREDPSLANGTHAAVVGGAPWGEPIRPPRRHDSPVNPRGGDSPSKSQHPHKSLNVNGEDHNPSEKRKRDRGQRGREKEKEEKRAGGGSHRSISPSTRRLIEDKAKALLVDGADSLKFHKQLMTHIRNWDEWRESHSAEK